MKQNTVFAKIAELTKSNPNANAFVQLLYDYPSTILYDIFVILVRRTTRVSKGETWKCCRLQIYLQLWGKPMML